MVQRRGLTLACFVVVFTLIGSISIYTDTLALQEWESHTSIGPVAMKVQGSNVQEIVHDVSLLPQVTSLSPVEKARAFLRMDQNDIYQGSPDDPMNAMFLIRMSLQTSNP